MPKRTVDFRIRLLNDLKDIEFALEYLRAAKEEPEEAFAHAVQDLEEALESPDPTIQVRTAPPTAATTLIGLLGAAQSVMPAGDSLRKDQRRPMDAALYAGGQTRREVFA